MANTKFEIILGILFLKFSNADVSLDKKTLIWWFYTTNKALFTTKWVQIIDKMDFVITSLDVNSEIFVVYVVIKK